MDTPLGEPQESTCQFCYRRRWSFSSAGITLAVCLFFVGFILVLPFRSGSWAVGLTVLLSACGVLIVSIVVPLVSTCTHGGTRDDDDELPSNVLKATPSLPVDDIAVHDFERNSGEYEL
jgi:hypothetical protein